MPCSRVVAQSYGAAGETGIEKRGGADGSRAEEGAHGQSSMPRPGPGEYDQVPRSRRIRTRSPASSGRPPTLTSRRPSRSKALAPSAATLVTP